MMHVHVQRIEVEVDLISVGTNTGGQGVSLFLVPSFERYTFPRPMHIVEASDFYF